MNRNRKAVSLICFIISGLVIGFSVCACSQTGAETTASESVTAAESSSESPSESTVDSVESEPEASISKRAELGHILGFENCYAESENTGPDHYYWRIFNSEGKEIACQFGFGCDSKPDIVIADIDGDGKDELLSNCVYGGDGAERAYVFRSRNGVIEVGTINREKLQKELGITLGANKYKVNYSAEKNQLVFVNSTDDQERVLTMDDLIFEEYTPGMF